MPRQFARRAHGVAFGQVQLRDMVRDQAIGPRIELWRLQGRILARFAGDVAGPVLVPDGDDPSVPLRPDTQALPSRMAVGGIVEHQRPLHRDLDRTLRRLRAQRGHHRVGPHEQLPAEAAADIRRIDADIVGIHFQDRAQRLAAPFDHLVGGPHGQLRAVPRRDGGERLHHRMCFVGRGVALVQLHRRDVEGAFEIADLGAVRRAIARQRRPGRDLREIEAALAIGIAGADQTGSGTGLFEGFSHDDRDRLMVMRDFAPPEQGSIVEIAACYRLVLGRGDDRDHAGRAARIVEIHRANPALGDPRPDNPAIGLIRRDIVPFGGVGRAARDLERAVDAGRRFADDLGAIEQVLTCGSVEFHGSSSSCRFARRRECPPGSARRAVS